MTKKKEILRRRRDSKDSLEKRQQRLENAIDVVNSWKDKKPDTSKPQKLRRNKCKSNSKRGCKGGLRSYQF